MARMRQATYTQQMNLESPLSDRRPGVPTDQNKDLIDSTDILGQPEELRQRGEKDGYLFFRGLLPKSDVLSLRCDLLAIVERYGWRQPGQDALGGRINLDALNRIPNDEMREDIGVSAAAYHDALSLESFNALPHHPKLIALYERLFQDQVLVHARHIGRMITGHRVMVPTPPHQDFPLIQGTSKTWTAWFPLGDCPRSMGGLTVLRGSHRLGYVPIQQSKGAGGIVAQTCPWETDWKAADFEAGDVLTFPSFTIHKALRCQDKELIRLSMDVRFQPASEPIHESSLQPHAELDWENIYADWESDELKYYWERYHPTLNARDETLVQPSRRIC